MREKGSLASDERIGSSEGVEETETESGLAAAGSRNGDGESHHAAALVVEDCPHYLANPEYHRCTKSCVEAQRRRRAMYGLPPHPMRAGMKEDRVLDDVVVMPHAEAVPRMSIHATGDNGLAHVQHLLEPVIFTDALEKCSVAEEDCGWAPSALRDVCEPSTVVLLHDRVPMPRTAVRASFEDYVAYVNGRSSSRVEEQKDGQTDSKSLMEHEFGDGRPLVLTNWRDGGRALRRMAAKVTPPLFVHGGTPDTVRPMANHHREPQPLNIIPQGGVVGLHRAPNETTAAGEGGTSWHAIVHGAAQVVLYSPEDTVQIAGDEIVRGATRFDPFQVKRTGIDEFASARRRALARVAVIGVGDVLMVPASWWWATKALETIVFVHGNLECAEARGGAAKGKAAEGHANGDARRRESACSPDAETLHDKGVDISVRCLAAKRIGNDYFVKKRYSSAEEAYSTAIRLLSAEAIENGNGPRESESVDDEENSALLATLLCNRAAVYLQQKRWSEVIDDCTASLRLSHSSHQFIQPDRTRRDQQQSATSTTAKLYFRRARALEMIGDADGAVRDMKKVLELEPNNKQARHYMQEYSSILNRLIIINRGSEDVKRKQIKGLYTGVPANYAA